MRDAVGSSSIVHAGGPETHPAVRWDIFFGSSKWPNTWQWPPGFQYAKDPQLVILGGSSHGQVGASCRQDRQFHQDTKIPQHRHYQCPEHQFQMVFLLSSTSKLSASKSKSLNGCHVLLHVPFLLTGLFKHLAWHAKPSSSKVIGAPTMLLLDLGISTHLNVLQILRILQPAPSPYMSRGKSKLLRVQAAPVQPNLNHREFHQNYCLPQLPAFEGQTAGTSNPAPGSFELFKKQMFQTGVQTETTRSNKHSISIDIPFLSFPTGTFHGDADANALWSELLWENRKLLVHELLQRMLSAHFLWWIFYLMFWRNKKHTFDVWFGWGRFWNFNMFRLA